MNSKILVLFIILFSTFSKATSLFAQNAEDDRLFQKWSVGAHIGTYGVGIYGTTSLSSNFNVRFGLNGITTSYNRPIHFNSDDIVTGLPVSGTFSNSKIRFFDGSLLTDYYPVKNGIFSITGGVYIGNNYVTTLGMVDDYTIGQRIEFDGIVITPNSDGSFDSKIMLGHVVNPYLGLGLGKKFSKGRIGFRLDAGVVYQGKFRVESDNITGADLTAIAKDVDVDFNKNLLTWWPMLNFSISYRIK